MRRPLPLALSLLLAAAGCGSPSRTPPARVPHAKAAPARAVPTPPRPGLHGSALVWTKALPSLRQLRRDRQNIVTASVDLGFAVTVENSGEWPESNFRVTLTIQQLPSPIVATKRVGTIRPGEQRTLVFRNLGQVVFATPTFVKVDIQPVPGEENTANNFARYPVVFSLG